MNMVKLSAETKRAVFRLLVRASLARHQSRAVEALGTSMGFELAADYRAENRHLLAMARDLVENDLFVQLQVQGKETRNAPTQVSATAAFRRLQVLCVLGQSSLLSSRSMAQGHALSRLQAPWAAPECGRSMALRTPNAMRQALTVPPS